MCLTCLHFNNFAIKYKMHKSKLKFHIYLVTGFIVFMVPIALHAHDPLIYLLLEWPLLRWLPLLAAIVTASIAKSWLLKRKLGLPWKLKPMEKLGTAVLAEIVVEYIFLSLIISFFDPTISSLINTLGLAASETLGSQILNLMAKVIIIAPYQLVIGTLLNMILINFLSPMDKDKRRQHLKHVFLLALIFPLLFIISLLIPFLINTIFPKKM